VAIGDRFNPGQPANKAAVALAALPVFNVVSVKQPPIILLAGPTASGKSHAALDLARRNAGVIVNADSMQVYAELRILTARPSKDDEEAIPHRLYGHVPAARLYSVGHWLEDVGAILGELRQQRRLPIVVGGTGLYFKALTEGLAPVPRAPLEIRAALRERLEAGGPQPLHAELSVRDPVGAGAVRQNDPSRILRALEVIEWTGKPLRLWQREAEPAPLVDPAEAVRAVLEPDRAELVRMIDRRVDRMIDRGALDEAKAFAALELDRTLPAMKAIGVRELLDHLSGRSTLDEAVRRMKAETRRYAKRQMTWFRHQMKDWPRAASSGDLEVLLDPRVRRT
jgi:tRNA dimethylallyltransferase